jgi:hypothetical protein
VPDGRSRALAEALGGLAAIALTQIVEYIRPAPSVMSQHVFKNRHLKPNFNKYLVDCMDLLDLV